MKKILYRVICTLFLIFLILPAIHSSAEPPPPPTPWELEIEEGLVFYMTPLDYEELGYPRSGLYREGELIYEVESYFYFGEVHFSKDGMSFLVVPRPGGCLWVVAFYKQGERVHVFTLDDVLENPERVSETTVGYFWEGPQGRNLNRDRNTLSVTTVEHNEITFDLSSGLIVDKFDLDDICGMWQMVNDEEVMSVETARRERLISISVLVVGTIIIGTGTILIAKKRKK